MIRARVAIERCNGVVKMKFRCLHSDRVLHYDPETASKIINACIVLHNLAIENNVPGYVESNILMEQNYNFNENLINIDIDNRNAGENARESLSNFLFS